jgi:hypothetical protein
MYRQGLSDDLPGWAFSIAARRLLWTSYGVSIPMDFAETLEALALEAVLHEHSENRAKRKS